MALAEWAQDLARSLLEEPLPRRWAHTQGVARQARVLAPVLGGEASLLEAAAWLHDIGYSPSLVETGFHPLDGARFLRNTSHADPRVCRLVAHHSYAIYEAQERALDSQLVSEFSEERNGLADALTYCDMTTSPQGSAISAYDRIRNIIDRYGSDSIVGRAIQRAEADIRVAVASVAQQLARS